MIPNMALKHWHISDSACIGKYALKNIPQEFVEISVLHILEDHNEWISLYANSIKLHYVLML